MRFGISALALLSAFLLPSVAHAIPYTFTLNGGGDNYVFTLDSNPTPDFDGGTFEFFGVNGSDTLDSGSQLFPTNFALGDGFVGLGEFAVDGPTTGVIFTGPLNAPVFTPGGPYSFTDADSNPYTLTISAVTTPEPSSLMLLGTGALGVVGTLRKKQWAECRG